MSKAPLWVIHYDPEQEYPYNEEMVRIDREVSKTEERLGPRERLLVMLGLAAAIWLVIGILGAVGWSIFA